MWSLRGVASASICELHIRSAFQNGAKWYRPHSGDILVQTPDLNAMEKIQ
jgi:hypothetical protein